MSKIKRIVKRKTGIATTKQDLRDKNNKPRASMRDSKAIGAYGVKDRDTLYLKKSPLMTIYVKTDDGKKVTIKNVKPTDTLRSVKRKVQRRTGIPKAAQLLQDRKGRLLSKDSKPIGEYGVKDRDTLRVRAIRQKARVKVRRAKKGGKRQRVRVGRAKQGIKKFEKAIKRRMMRKIRGEIRDLRKKYVGHNYRGP